MAALIGAGCSFLFSGLSYWAYHAQHSKIAAIKNAVRVPIEDAARVVEASENGTVPYAVVSGIVRADSDVTCLYSTAHRGVAYILTLKEHKAEWSSGTKTWQNVVRILSESRRDVPFWIEPASAKPGTGAPRVGVADWVRASGLNLSVVYDRFEPAASTATQSVVDYMRGELKKGIEHVEQVLPQGSPLTVVGELARASPLTEGLAAHPTPYAIVIRAPSSGAAFYASTKGIDAIIDEELASSYVWKWIAIGCAAAGAACLLYRLKGSVDAWRERRRQRAIRDEYERLRREAEAGGGNASVAASEGAEGAGQGNCVVCWARPPNAALLDCGHACACMECASALTQCPLCRAHIDRVVRLFS